MAATAVFALVGCGGSGGGSSTAPISGTRSAPSVVLGASGSTATTGALEVNYVSGAGRTEGDIHAVFGRINLVDTNGNSASWQSTAGLDINLASYNVQRTTVPVYFSGVTATSNSRFFDTYQVDPSKITLETSTGATTLLTESPFTTDIPARITVFPGRFTCMSMFLAPGVYYQDPTTSDVVFDSDIFKTLNTPSDPDSELSGKMVGFINDFVRFDISAMNDADKPYLYDGGSVSSTKAGNFFISGDDYALSVAGAGTSDKLFNMLTKDPTAPVEGFFSAVVATDSYKKGLWDIKTLNPSDLSGLSRITALQGYWRNSYQVLNFTNAPKFSFITFPGSQSDRNGIQQAVAIVWSGSASAPVITNLYYGEVDLTNKTFDIFPIKDINEGDIAGELTGTLSGYVNSAGVAVANGYEPAIRNGTFTFTSGSTLPTGFLSTGTFVVFRQ